VRGGEVYCSDGKIQKMGGSVRRKKLYQEKIELYEGMLKGKNEMIEKQERLLEQKK
jgi:hypothetical protein